MRTLFIIILYYYIYNIFALYYCNSNKFLKIDDLCMITINICINHININIYNIYKKYSLLFYDKLDFIIIREERHFFLKNSVYRL